jgi:outer membrane protein assembly factor BamB
LTLLAVGLLFTGSRAADWPQFRGANRDGVSRETGLLARWPKGGPEVLWSVPLGSGFSGLSVVGGRIYTMYGSGQDEFVAGFDASNGKQIWRVRVDSLWKSRWGDGPRSTPTVDGETLFALSAKGKLYALSAADGAERWSRDLEKDYRATPPQWGVSTSPLVEKDLLVLDVGGESGASVVALSKKTGEEVWRSQDDKPGYSTPIAITAGGSRQIVLLTGRNLISVAAEDGSLLWRVPWQTSYDVNAATPVFIPPDRVFVSTGYDVGAAVYRIESGQDGAGVTEIWKNREMKNKFSSSVLYDGHLYGFNESTLKCIDAATGETKWQQRGFGFGSLIYADGRLIVLGDDGLLALVEASSKAYQERGRAQVFQGKTWTLPTLVDGKLYLRDLNELIALDVSGSR